MKENATEKRAHDVAEGHGKPFRDSELDYAAFARCKCGAGMAAPKGMSPWGWWDCGAILTGTAQKGVQHEAQLPFVFYEVKSENQPSANGATTRPSGNVPKRGRIARLLSALLSLLALAALAAPAQAQTGGRWLLVPKSNPPRCRYAGPAETGAPCPANLIPKPPVPTTVPTPKPTPGPIQPPVAADMIVDCAKPQFMSDGTVQCNGRTLRVRFCASCPLVTPIYHFPK